MMQPEVSEQLTQAISSSNVRQVKKALDLIQKQPSGIIKIRLRAMALAISRDDPRILALLDGVGWLEGYTGELHPLSLAVAKRKTQTVQYLLDKGHYGNHDLVEALAKSIARAGDRVDKRRENIHRMLLERMERKPDHRTAWDHLLAAILGSSSGWLRAAHEKVTPQLFCEDQHAAFLELWPGDTRNQDRRTTQWLLEEGLNPEVASQKDSFWAQVARPFVAKVDEGRMLMATAPALAQAGRRENQRL